VIAQRLPGLPLVGTQGDRFSDLGNDWSVTANGPTVTVSGRLPAGANPGAWRALLERATSRSS
jgi:hypothetical protein